MLVRLQKGMYASFLVFVASKSIMDMFWDFKWGPLSILSIQGFMVPLMFLPLFKQTKRLPKLWMNTATVYLVALSLGLIWGLIVKPLATFESVIINVNIFLSFLLIPLLVQDRKHLKQFLLAMMVCGLFPIIVSFYQQQTGIIFRTRQTVGLTRLVGFYHDAFPVRFYGFMTLYSVLLYHYLFRFKSLFFKGVIFFLSSGALLSIHFVYSKAAIAVFGLWILVLVLFSKARIKYGLSILIGIFVIYMVAGDIVIESIEQLFTKEVAFQTGELTEARYTLAGRGFIWEGYWHFWIYKQPVFFQLLGDGIMRPTHNEFLRVLMASGIIGVLFLAIFIFRIVLNSFRIRKTVRVFGLMILLFYSVDCIGLTPGVYYYYNIILWGILGLLLLRPNLFIKQTELK